ncbi:MAG: CBS domain-containing protein [Candidatus Lokiarchaeota archaeon]|nr:CBS domain-containing protein [Candidatus Lokiarchaeota archaeon]
MVMLIKNITGIDTEDEYIKVSGEETLLEIAMKLVHQEKCDAANPEHMCTPILAAYVMEGAKPIGVIHTDDLIRSVIVGNRDPGTTRAREIMEKPACISETHEVREAINLLLDKGLLTLAVVDGDVLKCVLTIYDAIQLREAIADEP